jgi:hypothetical protein
LGGAVFRFSIALSLGWVFFFCGLSTGLPPQKCSELLASRAMHRDLKWRKAVVLVDPYSSGVFFGPYLQSLGYVVICVQSSLEAPGHYGIDSHNTYWDDGHDLNLLWEGKATLDYLREFNIVASLSPTDSGHVVSDQISFARGLPMNHPLFTGARGSKDLANQRLRLSPDIRLAKQVFGDLLTIEKWATGNAQWPIWLKPRKGTGNDSVSKCDSMDDVRAAYETIMSRPTQLGVVNTGVLAESDLPGTEYIADFVYRGNLVVPVHFAEYEKLKRYRPDGSITHIYKATKLMEGDGPLQRVFLEQGKRIVRGLGGVAGTSHIEIKESGMVEHNPRVVGAKLTKLVSIAIGEGPMEVWIEAMLEPEKFRKRKDAPPYKLKKQARLIHLISDHSGTITEVPYLEAIRRHPAWQYDYVNGPGEKLLYSLDVDSAPGLVYAAHEDPAVVEDLENKIRAWEANGEMFHYLPDEEELQRRSSPQRPVAN